MTAPGDDPADRALDDALALANDPPAGRGDRGSDASRRGLPANDPLAVALGHERPVRMPSPAEEEPAITPGRAQGSRPPGRVPSPGASPGDPLAVALGVDGGQDTPGRQPPGGSGHAEARTKGAARHGSGSQGAHRHGERAVAWGEARRIARGAGRLLPARVVPLGDAALGAALARSLPALTDLPSFDSSAMDGWAVAGAGPWRLAGRILAGRQASGPLPDGRAVAIATGAPLPAGATGVLRSEHGRTENRGDGAWLHVGAGHTAPAPGQDVRPRGQECRSGDELLPAGTVVTPAVLGLAAAAGYDDLAVLARPCVEVLVLGDELLDHGVPRGGRVRDALGPMLPSWLRALGADVTSVRRLVDDADALRDAVAGSAADVIVTTGGTAGGPVDHVHPVLAALGARLLVDGVAVRPGHPMLLAELRRGGSAGRAGSEVPGVRHLIGLPGNPLAAVSGVLTLGAPLLRALAGHPVPAPYAAPLTEDVHGHPVDTRLVPVVFDDESAARPLHFAGPAMLRGLAAADGMAVIPPGGAPAGTDVAVLGTGGAGAAWGSGG